MIEFKTDRPHEIVLPLSEKELLAIRNLAKKKDISEEAILRIALRFYELTDSRVSDGEIVSFSGDARRAREFLGKPEPEPNYLPGKIFRGIGFAGIAFGLLTLVWDGRFWGHSLAEIVLGLFVVVGANSLLPEDL